MHVAGIINIHIIFTYSLILLRYNLTSYLSVKTIVRKILYSFVMKYSRGFNMRTFRLKSWAMAALTFTRLHKQVRHYVMLELWWYIFPGGNNIFLLVVFRHAVFLVHFPSAKYTTAVSLGNVAIVNKAFT